MRENSFLKLSNTPNKPELTPINMRVFQKVDYNLKFNEEINESWSFQRPNNPLNSRNPRENESYSFIDNPKQGFELPLSSIWHGDHENMKNINKSYDIFNGNAQNFEQIIDKKVRPLENFELSAPLQNKAFATKEENPPWNNNNNKHNNDPKEKIQFHLFKKPTPMFQKKTPPQKNFVTPLKNSGSPRTI